MARAVGHEGAKASKAPAGRRNRTDRESAHRAGPSRAPAGANHENRAPHLPTACAADYGSGRRYRGCSRVVKVFGGTDVPPDRISIVKDSRPRPLVRPLAMNDV